MADLFQVIPDGLFHPLASPGAPVYAEILLGLLGETQRHHEPLSRDLAVQVVNHYLTAPEALALTLDSNDEQEPDAANDMDARAGAILRYLARCGWLKRETQSDFTSTFILPDYAFRLLRVLSEIATNEPPPLRGLICAIHDILQAAQRDGDIETRLPEAHRQMTHLLNGLKELQHNIGIHIERVLNQLSAREIMNEVFVSYRSEIVDRAYHQLRTTDHVSRYRPAVIETTGQLMRTDEARKAAQRLYARGEASGLDAAWIQLENQAREIREQFEALDTLLEAIDVRHSQFVDSAVRTVELQLNAISTTSGQLNSILSTLLTRTPEMGEHDQEALTAPLINLFELELIDSNSLAPPGRAPVPFVSEPETVTPLSDEEIAAQQADTLRQMNRAISRERVRRFAQALLANRQELRGAEINIERPDDLPLLIYLRTYGDGSLGYRVEPVESAEWVERGSIGFRDFVIKKA